MAVDSISRDFRVSMNSVKFLVEFWELEKTATKLEKFCFILSFDFKFN